MSYYSRNQTCDPDRVRYLEDELAYQREDKERQRNEEERERKERQQEYEEQREIKLRSASSWPEALRKQITLFSQELNATMWGKPLYGPNATMPDDDFFGPGIEACERALALWKEVEATRQEQIKTLEFQIAAIREGVKLEVADRLEAEGVDKPMGWISVADAIRDEDPERWLDW